MQNTEALPGGEASQLRAELERRDRQIGFLIAVGRAAAEAAEVGPLVERVLGGVLDALACDLATIHLVGEGSHLHLAGLLHPNAPVDEAVVRMMSITPIDERSLLGRAAGSRASLVAQRGGWPEGTRPFFEAIGASFAVATPLLYKGSLVGTIGAIRTEPRPFTSDEIQLLEACAGHLAATVEQVRLHEAERRRVEEVRLLLEIGRLVTASLDLHEILDAAAESVARMVGGTHSHIWLLDGDGMLRGVTTSQLEHREHFRSVRLTPDDPSLAARAVATRGPVQAADALHAAEVNQTLNARYGMKSLLALPLMVRDETIGAVVIGDCTRIRHWLPAEIERATVVARHVAVAVANARLFEDLKGSYDELARTQRALVERERLAALGELAAVVAHEVRNPLGIIWNSLVSLRKLLPRGGDVAMLLGILGEESDRLNRIVADLLEFARPHEPALRPEALGPILRGAVESARSAGIPEDVELDLAGSLDLPPVMVDARLVRQAFINLVTNAVQAMPQGGRVTVRATEEQFASGSWARVDVIDEGAGIPQAVAEQVFQPFFTTKATGTGLGLAVVKRIIDAHQGDVTVRSGDAAGTTFTVRLPFAARAGV